jgi:hypothetical protein
MPQLTEVAPLAADLTALTLGTPTTAGAITVVPLHRPSAAEPGWLTLAEAGGWVIITEVSDSGAVPTLTVTNNADRPVLLLDGEDLLGARQNRILNTTVLVAADGTATIPVSCVEQGRWSYRSRRFISSDYWLYASLRRMKAARVSDSLRRGGRHESDQGEVWDELADKAAHLRVDSPTGAMHAVYEQYAETLKAARKAIAPAAVVERVLSASVEPAPPLGLGQEYRIGSGHVVGAALVVHELVAHLAAFPAVLD